MTSEIYFPVSSNTMIKDIHEMEVQLLVMRISNTDMNSYFLNTSVISGFAFLFGLLGWFFFFFLSHFVSEK